MVLFFFIVMPTDSVLISSQMVVTLKKIFIPNTLCSVKGEHDAKIFNERYTLRTFKITANGKNKIRKTKLPIMNPIMITVFIKT